METKKALMVGYLQSWGNPTITFTEAAKKGYTAIVLAFGTVTGTEIGIADGKFIGAPTEDELKKDIENAKKQGAEQILFSVGGSNNTFLPQNAKATDLAKAIVKYLKEYGFTGIDFDLEIDGDSTYLDELCKEIKSLNSDLLITAAPQVNQGSHESDLMLVSDGIANIFKDAVENNRFDYLFIQCYNNPWPQINNYKQTDVEFISAAFNNLKKSIPETTLIAIGEPANKDAAGTSPFTVSEVPQDIYKLMAKQYSSISGDPSFGGAMVWSVNLDCATNYQFVDHVKSAIVPIMQKDAVV